MRGAGPDESPDEAERLLLMQLLVILLDWILNHGGLS